MKNLIKALIVVSCFIGMTNQALAASFPRFAEKLVSDSYPSILFVLSLLDSALAATGISQLIFAIDWMLK